MIHRLHCRYNRMAVNAFAFFLLVMPPLLFSPGQLFCPSLRAENVVPPSRTAPAPPATNRTMVVIPFENASPTPGLEWLGESFPETFHEQLSSPVLYVASRDERLRAYDRQGIPASVHPSRATLYRLAEQMDLDYALLGSYSYDGSRLTVNAQLLDMRAPRLLPIVTESGSLPDLVNLQSALAWDLLHEVREDFPVAKDKYIASIAPVRLDATENYIRGVLATSAEEKVQYYREAVRLNPLYSSAWLQLGKIYYNQHSYEPAVAALGEVPRTSLAAREAYFYLGLAAYAEGDFAKSDAAFEFVAARLPLAEVYNNLGVVAARRGQKKASEYFEKAIENDPSDPDYHFNLAATLIKTGDRSGATRELHAALERRPNDADAKQLLDSLASSSSTTVQNGATALARTAPERIKRDYEEDTFRQMTTQMQGWAEQRFARSDPKAHARFHVELGKELLAHGFTTEAEGEFQHAAAIDPSSSAPLTALAEDYEAIGDTAQARSEAEAALRIRESADAHLVLARLDLKENKTDSAVENVNRALKLEPGNTAGLNMKRSLTADKVAAEKAAAK